MICQPFSTLKIPIDPTSVPSSDSKPTDKPKCPKRAPLIKSGNTMLGTFGMMSTKKQRRANYISIYDIYLSIILVYVSLSMTFEFLYKGLGRDQDGKLAHSAEHDGEEIFYYTLARYAANVHSSYCPKLVASARLMILMFSTITFLHCIATILLFVATATAKTHQSQRYIYAGTWSTLNIIFFFGLAFILGGLVVIFNASTDIYMYLGLAVLLQKSFALYYVKEYMHEILRKQEQRKAVVKVLAINDYCFPTIV